MAVQSVALACQNLLLAAHAYGLGACWMCAPLFVPHVVRQVLELPAAWQPQALITLGYPAEEKSSTALRWKAACSGAEARAVIYHTFEEAGSFLEGGQPIILVRYEFSPI